MTHPNEDLVRKVRRLDAANRVLMALVAVALVVPWVLFGRAGSADAAAADGAGVGEAPVGPTGVLTVRGIRLVDDEGRVRMELRHDESETGLFILDDQGDTRLGAAQFAHGGGGYALHGPGGRGAAVLYLKGEGSLTMYAEDGAVTSRVPEAPR